MSIDEILIKERTECTEEFSHEELQYIIKEYISKEGPKETSEIKEYLYNENYGVGYCKIKNALHIGNTFSHLRWDYVFEKILEPLNLRKPYGKRKNMYIWEINELSESEKEKRLKNFARKKSKN